MPNLPPNRDPGAPVPIPVNPNWTNGNMAAFCYNGVPWFIGLEGKFQQGNSIFNSGKVIIYYSPSPGMFIKFAEIFDSYYYSYQVIGKYLYLFTINAIHVPLVTIYNLDLGISVFSQVYAPIVNYSFGPDGLSGGNPYHPQMTYRSKIVGGSIEEICFYLSGRRQIDLNNYTPILWGIAITRLLIPGTDIFTADFLPFWETFPPYVRDGITYFDPYFNHTYPLPYEEFFGNCVGVIGDTLFYYMNLGQGLIWNDHICYIVELPSDYKAGIILTASDKIILEQNNTIDYALRLAYLKITNSAIFIGLYDIGGTTRTTVWKLELGISLTLLYDFKILDTYPNYYYPQISLYGYYRIYHVDDTSLIFFYIEDNFQDPHKPMDVGNDTFFYHTIYRGEYLFDTDVLTVTEYYNGYNLLFDDPTHQYIIPDTISLRLYMHSLVIVEDLSLMTFTAGAWIDLGDGPIRCWVAYTLGVCSYIPPNVNVGDQMVMSDNFMIIRSGLGSPVFPLPPGHPDNPVNSIYCKDWKLVDNSSPLETTVPETWYEQG